MQDSLYTSPDSDSATWEEIVTDLIVELESLRRSQWRIGDILVCIVDQSRDRSEALKVVASSVGEDYDLLDEYERTARRWPPERRYPNLRWSVYQRLQPDDEGDLEILELAADNSLTPSQVKSLKYPKTATVYAQLGLARASIEKALSQIAEATADSQGLDSTMIETLRVALSMISDLIDKIKERSGTLDKRADHD